MAVGRVQFLLQNFEKDTSTEIDSSSFDPKIKGKWGKYMSSRYAGIPLSIFYGVYVYYFVSYLILSDDDLIQRQNLPLKNITEQPM